MYADRGLCYPLPVCYAACYAASSPACYAAFSPACYACYAAAMLPVSYAANATSTHPCVYVSMYDMYVHTCAGNEHVDEHTCIRVYECMQATPTSTDTHVVCCVAGNGHVDCATILLRVGANVNHQNNHGLLLSIYVYLCIYVYVRTYVSGHSCL